MRQSTCKRNNSNYSPRSYSYYKGNKVSAVGDTRILWVGGDYGPSSTVQFKNNRIVTSKYTIWNFLPKNLFEQFRRVANFYFLCMVVIAFSIDSPLDPLTTVLPLIFVISVTCIKQGYEDWLRHRSDNEVNSTQVTVIRKGIVQDIKAKDLHVGDLVRLVSDADVPCDLVLLSSSHTDGRCYITTANLDGETNLKTLVCPRLLRNLPQPEELARLKAQIECEQPTADLYRFTGKIEIFPNEVNGGDELSNRTSVQRVRTSQHAYKFDGIELHDIGSRNGDITLQQRGFENNIALRGASVADGNVPTNHNRDPSVHRTSVNRSTHSEHLYSFPVDESSFVTGQAAMNQTSSSDGAAVWREGSDAVQNVECRVGAFGDKTDVTRDMPSCKGQALNSSPVTGDVNFTETEVDGHVSSDSNGDSTLLRAAVRNSIISRQGTVTDYSAGQFDSVFQDIKISPLGTENLLLRGARLKNTEFVIGCAVYTGQESKLALNSKLTRNKFSTVEKSLNAFLLFFFVLLLVEVAVSVAFKYYVEGGDKHRTLSYLGPQAAINVGVVFQDIFSFLLLYNYIIPISLYVTVETQKFIGSLFFGWDKELYCEKIDQPAICNTSDLNEELGQVEYLFTDKTGTLTENIMWFKRCSVAGITYHEDGGKMFQLTAAGDERSSILMDTFTPEMEHFLLALALCHSVQVGTGRGHTNNNTDTYPIASLNYQASSPDEKALVEASARCGMVFLGEEGECMSVMVKGRVCHYKKLDTLEFTSERRRMSVVVQDTDGQIWLYCKGAESSVIPLTEAGPIHDTLQHVADFALRGLRTLVLCYRKLSIEQYSQLASLIAQSRQTLSSKRASVIAASYDKMEANLTLLGATGVEDQLQDGVQETLESMRAAGIKVWILTGDKVETAVNISFSCGHLKPSAQQLYLTEHTTSETCLRKLDMLRNQVTREHLEHYVLVVDGQSLYFILDASEEHLEAFQAVCRACTSVICCRMSPLQKCQVVHLVKGFPERPITAAIGDGANDVSMIQEAHVGLGIMGKEGWQAVRCSDFAFARFKFLRRVLLVHGHWYYVRVATLVQYFFYKNILFITPQLYYAFSNGFSTQPIYDTLFLTLYNVLFTSLPILLFGLFEQNIPAKTLLEYPQLYSNNRHNVLMSWSTFSQWIMFGVWHSVVLYFVPYFMLLESPVILYNNSPMEMMGFGTFIFHCVVCVANLKLVLKSRYWTWLFILSTLVLTICGTILIIAVYSIVVTSEMLYVYPILLGSLTFWLLSVLLIVTCLVPDCAFSVLQGYTPAASAKLRKSWRRAFGNKNPQHYSLRRSDAQRRSSGHAANSWETGVSPVSCRSIS